MKRLSGCVVTGNQGASCSPHRGLWGPPNPLECGKWHYTSAKAQHTLARKIQIPPDLVVKTKALILLRLFRNYSDELPLFKRRVETGNHGVNGFHHPRPMSPPLNPMECGQNPSLLLTKPLG